MPYSFNIHRVFGIWRRFAMACGILWHLAVSCGVLQFSGRPVNSEWLCHSEMAVFNPLQDVHPSIDHQKFVIGDYSGDPYSCAIFGAHPSTGGFWANGWNITKFYYLFMPFSGIHLQVRTVDGFLHTTTQTMQGCAFFIFVDMAANFGGQIGPNTCRIGVR